MTEIVLLGAEVQAATSLAAAYPLRRFLFVSDAPVLDGWDLPNVRFRRAGPSDWRAAPADIAVCPRWIAEDGRRSLSALMERIAARLPDAVLPVRPEAGRDGRWVGKGDRWHRPDAPLAGTASDLAAAEAPPGCGLVFQPFVEASARVMAIGRRAAGGALAIGLFHVHEERFFRDAIVQAAETIDAPDLVDLSAEALDAADLAGHFTLNWLMTEGGWRLSSVRPVLRGVCSAFRRADIDLLQEPVDAAIVAPGLKFVSRPAYASYGTPA